MKLSTHFSLAELTASDYAMRHGLDNTPPRWALDNLQRLAENLETVRSVLGHPLYITSAFRSALVNKGTGGSPRSFHMQGLAADFVCPGFGTPLEICQELIMAGILFDQLIQEGRWVHYSIPAEGEAWRREILTAHFKGGSVTYTKGLA